MSYCLLCNTNYKPQIDFKDLFLFKKPQEKAICPNCLSKFEKINGQHCMNCNKAGQKVKFCSDCRVWQVKYQGKLLKNKSIYRYNQAMHDLMVNYKRYGDYVLHQVLADLIKSQISPADYYVPIPTSKSHIARRQFDTVSEIFKDLVPLTFILGKIDNGSAQGEKNRQQRLKTEQSFYVNEKLNLQGNILLLDDIYTTGRTLYHARDALAAAFPNSCIKSFTLAR
ncbi:competence protein ComFC [Lactobacillus colini]|uniref:Competence protein ComFC n=1 Tax=Lactobacillus colini TaxID=1819254 RepID=A0ABS4MD95_9LACO|nr:ComF family protein [Lactobacillus colini]MBP2057653.1 competence protein ComFC [Lactobacillus colini]